MKHAASQYIEFYEANTELVNANSAAALNEPRERALSTLRSRDLPRKGDAGYDIMGLDELFAPDYGINAGRLTIPADVREPFRCDVPNMSTWMGFMVNDAFASGELRRLPEGVIVGSLRKVAEENPALVSRFYGKIASADDPQVALNTLLAQDGVMIYVPSGVKLERPLQIVNILSGAVPMMSSRRWLIVVGDNAEAKLLVCDHTQSRDVEMLSNQVIEVAVGRNSRFDLYDMEESSELTRRASSLWVRQDADSNVLIDGITLVNGITRNNINVDVTGRGAETHLLGMAIAKNTQVVDNHTRINHRVGNCHSNELFKYLVDDRSRCSFIGRIMVAEGASKVEAYQSNKNIVASREARMHTKPELEIYCDDVKCSHGTTVGQLDNEAIFYMRSRGIPEAEARLLLMQAFMADVIDGVRIPSLAVRLRQLTERRLGGGQALCGDCAADCDNKN